jgi:integration host factor subunit beta
MKRSDLITQLAAKNTKFTAQDINLTVRTILDALSGTLADGKRIEIRGFGVFSLSYRPPRNGRNPKTGVAVLVPAKYVPHFKAGKELRDRVDISDK